jgi:2'-5' RNA ligase
MNLRSFIAIELPREIKENIDKGTEGLKSTGADVKWVKADNLHLTLKFLGNTPERYLHNIKDRLESVAKLHNKFDIRISGVGVFPNTKNLRVVWIGIKDSEMILKLQRDIDESLKEFGFEIEDREFKPHLTIGRVRSHKNKDILIKELATLKTVDFGKIEVKSIALMKSELKPTGAEYFTMSEILLGGRN